LTASAASSSAPLLGGATRPLTVLHVDTERGWRGGERQVLWLVEGLAQLGHRSVVAARPDEPLAEEMRRRDVPVVELAPTSEFDVAAALRLRRSILRLRADVVHAHSGHAVALSAVATLGTRARMVVSRRVDFPVRRNPASRWKYARAHAIIAVSRAAADALIGSGIDRSRVEVIHSGVDLSRSVRPATAQTLAALGVSPGAPLAVMACALVNHKDPVTYVRAIEKARRSVPNLQAVLAGDGYLRPAVERAASSLSLEGTLRIVGDRADADSLLAAADVVVMSSREEGLGSVAIDAMSFGKPVAATAAGGIPEVVEHGRTGLLVPVGDADALGDAVARLVRDPRLAASLGRNGLARAPSFSIERTVSLTASVYERLTSSGTR